jgi:ParB-like chromosome segregation protein Spo0J
MQSQPEEKVAKLEQGKKAPAGVEIPTERIRLEAPLHQVDWPRRAEVVPAFAERVAQVRASGEWPGEPIRVRKAEGGYILVSGFSRLAVAVEAGLPRVRATIEPRAERIPLDQIHLRPWQQNAHLNPKKLAQRRQQAEASGDLPAAIVVRPAQRGEPEGYVLLDGLYWYHVAREMGLESAPAIVQKARRRGPQ